MVDIIAGDGDTVDILAGPGDRVFVNEGITFLAQIINETGGAEVFIDGTVQTDDVHAGVPNPLYPAVDLRGGGHTVEISATGLVDAENGVWISGDGVDFTNHGVIRNSVTDWQTTFQSIGVVIHSESGSFQNTGTIGQNTQAFQYGVAFSLDPSATSSFTAENIGTIRGFVVGVVMDQSGMIFENSGTVVGEIEGVSMWQGGSTLINTGVIKSVDTPAVVATPGYVQQDPIAVVMDGIGNTVENHGRMIGAIMASGDDHSVVNTGLIRSEGQGVAIGEDWANAPVFSGFTLHNSGTIEIKDDGDMGSVGVDIRADMSSVTNEGDIIGAEMGVSMYGDGNTLDNSGLIESIDSFTLLALLMEGDELSMTNTGEIRGSATLIGNGISVLNKAGGLITHIDGVRAGLAVEGSDIEVCNNGTIVGGEAGVRIGVDGRPVDGAKFVNAGVIYTEPGTPGNDFGVSMWGTGLQVINRGEISSNFVAVAMTGDGAVLRNSGTLEASAPDGFSFGAQVVGAGARVVNLGVITAEFGGLWVHGDGAQILNRVDGRIEATGDQFGSSYGLRLGGSDLELVNDGVIRGTTGGVVLFGEYSGLGPYDNVKVVNTGLIENTGVPGQTDSMWALHLEASDSTITNDGIIRGTFLGASTIGDNVKIVNRGTIEVTDPSLGGAAVAMAGADVVFRNKGEVIGDVLFFGLEGEAGATYDGRNGRVEGRIVLSQGDDTAIGGDFVDVIEGRRGRDDINGGKGADIIDGGKGRDTITGGRQADLLTGGRGADTFVITERNGRDEVTDFEVDLDHLDLRALGDLTFAQISAAMSDTSDGVLLDLSALGGSGSVLLADVTVAELDRGDFLFL